MLDFMPLILVGIFALVLVLERLFPGRPLPAIKRWLPKGIAFFVMSFVLGGMLPELLIPVFTTYRFFDLTGLGLVGGTFVAMMASELLSYAFHRTQHNVPFIWRWTHQMHHSAERVDAAGAFIFHPLDTLAYTVLGSGAGALLGVMPEAAGLAGAIGFAMACFQHANLKTPVWLGWFVQRPEGHAIHHQRGVHAFNYGNIALFDQLFGTYRNPRTYGDEKAGFWDGASAQILPMLVGRDVGEKRVEQPIEPAMETSTART